MRLRIFGPTMVLVDAIVPPGSVYDVDDKIEKRSGTLYVVAG